jgi:hypothetical protein
MNFKKPVVVTRASMLAIIVCITISGYDRLTSAKEAGEKPLVQVPVDATESKQKLFQRPVSAFVRDRFVAVQMSATGGGEKFGESWHGLFQAPSIVIKLASRKMTEIEVADFSFFSTGPGQHDACGKLVFRDVAGRICFDYMYGTGNPYPPQIVKYLDEDADEFVSADNIFKEADPAFLDFDKKGCVSAVTNREPLKGCVCFRDGRYAWERIRLDYSTQQKSYSFECDLTKSSAAVLDAVVPAESQLAGSPGLLPTEAIVGMEKMCEDFRKSHGERDIPGKTRRVVSPVTTSPSQAILKDADSVSQATSTSTATKTPS